MIDIDLFSNPNKIFYPASSYVGSQDRYTVSLMSVEVYYIFIIFIQLLGFFSFNNRKTNIKQHSQKYKIIAKTNFKSLH